MVIFLACTNTRAPTDHLCPADNSRTARPKAADTFIRTIDMRQPAALRAGTPLRVFSHRCGPVAAKFTNRDRRRVGQFGDLCIMARNPGPPRCAYWHG